MWSYWCPGIPVKIAKGDISAAFRRADLDDRDVDVVASELQCPPGVAEKLGGGTNLTYLEVVEQTLPFGGRGSPGELSRLGFDALALVVALSATGDNLTVTPTHKWAQKLVTTKGFQGYSGAFRLLPDGGNVRA